MKTINTFDDLKVIGMPSGFERLLDFCRQVESGEAPDPEILRDLAAAFRAMMNEGEAKKRPAFFMKAMNLQGRGGRPRKHKDTEPKFRAVLEVFLIDPDGKNRAKVVEKIAEQYHADESRVYSWIREHQDSAEPTVRWIRSIENKHRSKGKTSGCN